MGEDLKSMIVEKLKRTYDPEIPIDVWNLGLIYGIDVDEGGKVKVRMTLTTMACPIAYLLVENVRRAVMDVEGVREVEVELVWEPAWNPTMMTPEGRNKFKAIYGYDIVEEYEKRWT